MSKKSSAPAKADPNRLDVFSVREYEVQGDTRRDWTRLGVAFEHQDGKGWNVVLHALPLDGKLVLRQPTEKEESAG